jgi:hypothetical protein
LSYLRTRFPPHTDALAAAISFGCLIVGYELATGGRIRLLPVELVGALTTVLLFLHLRLVDDLDDASAEAPAAALPAMRRQLVGGQCAVALAVLVLNVAWPAAAITALAAMALAVVTPFVVKPLTKANRWVIGPCYEGTPLLILAYSYVHWTTVTGRSAPTLAVFGVIGAFWAAYEFWKFSRKAGEAAFQPYGLRDPALRLVLLLVLATCAACALAFGLRAHLSWFFLGYAGLVPAGFAAWLLLRWPRPGRSHGPAWRGLLLADTLIVAIGVQTVLAEVGRR